jgi:hypothetical protein
MVTGRFVTQHKDFDVEGHADGVTGPVLRADIWPHRFPSPIGVALLDRYSKVGWHSYAYLTRPSRCPSRLMIPVKFRQGSMALFLLLS